MPFRPVPHPKVADCVVDEFETLLLHGVLRPGDKLPPERELAETLGVSRSSLRDAMDGLEARGLIERRRGSGATVCELVATTLVDPLGALVARRPETMRDFLAFRRLIEREAAAEAAKAATATDLDRIELLLDKMRVARKAGEIERESALDVEFHLAVVEAAGNAVATQVMRALAQSITRGIESARAKVYARPAFPEALMAQHEEIAAAVAARDPERAAAASDAHLDYIAAELAQAEDAARRDDLAGRRLARQLKTEQGAP